MAYDEKLAARIRALLSSYPNVEEKKMFGGLCFMVAEHMCCGIVGETLMARVGPDQYDNCLKEEFARKMDFTGKAMKGMVYVDPTGIRTKTQLKRWVERCAAFIATLPPKKSKRS